MDPGHQCVEVSDACHTGRHGSHPHFLYRTQSRQSRAKSCVKDFLRIHLGASVLCTRLRVRIRTGKTERGHKCPPQASGTEAGSNLLETPPQSRQLPQTYLSAPEKKAASRRPFLWRRRGLADSFRDRQEHRKNRGSLMSGLVAGDENQHSDRPSQHSSHFWISALGLPSLCPSLDIRT